MKVCNKERGARFLCACQVGSRRCWPISDAAYATHVRRQGLALNDDDDEIEVLKSRRYRPEVGTPFDSVTSALCAVFDGPSYEQTYRQRLLTSSICGYQRRRSRILGTACETYAAIAERVGYVRKHRAGALVRAWSREALFARLITKESIP